QRPGAAAGELSAGGGALRALLWTAALGATFVGDLKHEPRLGKGRIGRHSREYGKRFLKSPQSRPSHGRRERKQSSWMTSPMGCCKKRASRFRGDDTGRPSRRTTPAAPPTAPAAASHRTGPRPALPTGPPAARRGSW